MKTWHKMTLRTLGALVVLLLLAAVASRVLVNPEKLKALAREKAQSAWSREAVTCSCTTQPSVTIAVSRSTNSR